MAYGSAADTRDAKEARSESSVIAVPAVVASLIDPVATYYPVVGGGLSGMVLRQLGSMVVVDEAIGETGAVLSSHMASSQKRAVPPSAQRKVSDTVIWSLRRSRSADASDRNSSCPLNEGCSDSVKRLPAGLSVLPSWSQTSGDSSVTLHALEARPSMTALETACLDIGSTLESGLSSSCWPSMLL